MGQFRPSHDVLVGTDSRSLDGVAGGPWGREPYSSGGSFPLNLKEG